MITFYSSGCPNCITLKQLMDKKSIEYELVTDEKVYLPIAGKYNIDFMPFAEINGQIYNTKALQKYIVKYKEEINVL